MKAVRRGERVIASLAAAPRFPKSSVVSSRRVGETSVDSRLSPGQLRGGASPPTPVWRSFGKVAPCWCTII